MRKLTKKKKRFKVFLEESEMFLTILVLAGIALFCFLDYWLARLEYLFIPKNISLNVDKELVPYVPEMFIVMLMLINLGVLLLFWSLIIPGVRKLIALNNYCYIPLTEDEVRSFGFASAGEYFNHVSRKLCYGKDIYNITRYVQLKYDDLQKMLAVCLKMFPDNGTIFGMGEDDCENICDTYCYSFARFLEKYHENYENKKDYVPSARIDKDGTVILSVLDKDGFGIMWDGLKISKLSR